MTWSNFWTSGFLGIGGDSGKQTAEAVKTGATYVAIAALVVLGVYVTIKVMK